MIADANVCSVMTVEQRRFVMVCHVTDVTIFELEGGNDDRDIHLCVLHGLIYLKLICLKF